MGTGFVEVGLDKLLDVLSLTECNFSSMVRHWKEAVLRRQAGRIGRWEDEPTFHRNKTPMPTLNLYWDRIALPYIESISSSRREIVLKYELYG